MARSPDSEPQLVSRSLLLRYRVLAYATATLLTILVFCGVPLQLAFGQPAVANVVGTIHGFLYIVYLFTAFDLARRIRMRFWRMALVLLAGTIPFAAVVAERKLTPLCRRLANGEFDPRWMRSPGEPLFGLSASLASPDAEGGGSLQ